ncbi:cell wall hydrolase [Methylobacterium sp. WSM2598]|uniref:cell wall hydrolase n=1 Tax=Methylobacterium sp. WSM2598 TaxID=398261 RepID=UPI00039B7EF8|nr:cell wall hydrolase [Methylobacterium sp. WSM2598]
MRITANSESKYPLLGSLLEEIGEAVSNSPNFCKALIESSGVRDDDVYEALNLNTNPWIEVDVVENSDGRGKYDPNRPNTILISKEIVDRLSSPGGVSASRECAIVLCRGILHWLAKAEWSQPSSPPGAAFELLVATNDDLQFPSHEVGGSQLSPGANVSEADPSQRRKSVSYKLGATILDVAKQHLGKKYAFTPTPQYDQPDWPGPFDCAEYVSYCAFRAYDIPYGVVIDPISKYNSYTGYWKRDAEKLGIMISWRDALHIPGAILLRFPPSGEPPPYGHIAISLGNGEDIYEARGAKYGVVKSKATGREWNTGVLIPGVLYDTPDGTGGENLIFKVLQPLAGYSPCVEQIEQRLADLEYLAPIQIDGVYDLVTAKAVSAFQNHVGIAVDGEVGPDTGRALGLGEIWDKAPVPGKPALSAPPPDSDSAIAAEILVLARTLYGEARGEPLKGIQAVANVIINRVNSGRYPNTISKVCLQRRQFSCWNIDDPNYKLISKLKFGDNSQFDEIYKVAQSAVMGELPNIIGDALHYHATSITPSWIKNSPRASEVATIGNHRFWSNIR